MLCCSCARTLASAACQASAGLKGAWLCGHVGHQAQALALLLLRPRVGVRLARPQSAVLCCAVLCWDGLVRRQVSHQEQALCLRCSWIHLLRRSGARPLQDYPPKVLNLADSLPPLQLGSWHSLVSHFGGTLSDEAAKLSVADIDGEARAL